MNTLTIILALTGGLLACESVMLARDLLRTRAEAKADARRMAYRSRAYELSAGRIADTEGKALALAKAYSLRGEMR